jgi:hypothetical protein
MTALHLNVGDVFVRTPKHVFVLSKSVFMPDQFVAGPQIVGEGRFRMSPRTLCLTLCDAIDASPQVEICWVQPLAWVEASKVPGVFRTRWGAA